MYVKLTCSTIVNCVDPIQFKVYVSLEPCFNSLRRSFNCLW